MKKVHHGTDEPLAFDIRLSLAFAFSRRFRFLLALNTRFLVVFTFAHFS